MKKSLLLAAAVGALALFGSPQVSRADHHGHHHAGHVWEHGHLGYGFRYDLGYHHRYSHHYYGLGRSYYRYRGFSVYTPGFSLSIGSGYYHHPAFRGHRYRYRGFCCP